MKKSRKSKSKLFHRRSSLPHFLNCSCKCAESRLTLQFVLEKRKNYAPPSALSHKTRTCRPRPDGPDGGWTYHEHHGLGPPSQFGVDFGEPGDIYVDETVGKNRLYAQMNDGTWKTWPGPLVVKLALHHPIDERYVLWSSSSDRTPDIGWVSEKKIRINPKGSVHDNIIGALEARSARENVQESQKLEKLKALSAKKRPKNPHDDIEASPARKPKKNKATHVPSGQVDWASLLGAFPIHDLQGESGGLPHLDSRPLFSAYRDLLERHFLSLALPDADHVMDEANQPNGFGSVSELSTSTSKTIVVGDIDAAVENGDTMVDMVAGTSLSTSRVVPEMSGPADSNSRDPSSSTCPQQNFSASDITSKKELGLEAHQTGPPRRVGSDTLRKTSSVDSMQVSEDLHGKTVEQQESINYPANSSPRPLVQDDGVRPSTCSSVGALSTPLIKEEPSINGQDSLPLDQSRLDIVFYPHTPENSSKRYLICRLCLGGSPPRIVKFQEGESPDVLDGHCWWKHPATRGILKGLDEDQLTDIRNSLI